MLHTTLNKIRLQLPCSEGWAKLLKYLDKTSADDEILPFSVILESNGIEDAIWCMRSAPEYNKEWLLYAIWCARKVQYLMTDERSINILDVAERFANGEATQEELIKASAAARAWAAAGAAARDAAWAAASDAVWGAASAAASAAAWAAAGAAAWAAARDAASDAAWAAASDAVWDAASAAASAAARDAAWAAASAAAWAAARDAASDAQSEQFLKIVG